MVGRPESPRREESLQQSDHPFEPTVVSSRMELRLSAFFARVSIVMELRNLTNITDSEVPRVLQRRQRL
jgi:hypothetical protein